MSVNTMKLTLGDMQLEVVVDSRGCPSELLSIRFEPGRPLLVFLQRIEESKSLEQMLRIIGKSRRT